jgi:hypothetical protein
MSGGDFSRSVAALSPANAPAAVLLPCLAPLHVCTSPNISAMIFWSELSRIGGHSGWQRGVQAVRRGRNRETHCGVGMMAFWEAPHSCHPTPCTRQYQVPPLLRPGSSPSTDNRDDRLIN